MPPVPQGIFTLWIEEMKVLTIDDEAARKSATVIPMLSAAGQGKQNPNNKELQKGDTVFHYDGKFSANPQLLGDWPAVAVVPTGDALDPAKPVDAGRAPIKAVTFKDGGLTASVALIWSGDTLLDRDHFQALKMTLTSMAAATASSSRPAPSATRTRRDGSHR